MIAEAWDAGGLYQVGRSPATRWAEWNGRFRDDVRRFVKGDAGLVGAVATRIAGSADLYQADGRAARSTAINFVTRHDGFTLNDLVSYNDKHNEANGEGNRDGSGRQPAAGTAARRARRTTPAIAGAARAADAELPARCCLLSQGVPMLLMGDEVGRTQRGNNNAYCQDNEITWFDWTLVAAPRGPGPVHELADRVPCPAHPSLRRTSWFTGLTNARGLPELVARHPSPVARVERPVVAGACLHAGGVPGLGRGRPPGARHGRPRDAQPRVAGPGLRPSGRARAAVAAGDRHGGLGAGSTSRNPAPASRSPARRSASGTAAWWS